MAKAVFTVSETSGYDDLKEQWYHFPDAYLARAKRALGDEVVFYQPRRNSGPRRSDGSQSYYATARVVRIREDHLRPGHHFADLANYAEFDSQVPFKINGNYFEATLRKPDGTTNRGSFGHSVRLISDEEFSTIMALGFAKSVAAVSSGPEPRYELDSTEPELPERAAVPVTTMRKVRHAAFRINVLKAYKDTCAITGLRLIDHFGRAEVQAAHVRAVAKNGSDSVRNGIAMTATVHWLFDRGLISISDNYSLLIANQAIPFTATISMLSQLLLPADPRHHPHPEYLSWHRSMVFRG